MAKKNGDSTITVLRGITISIPRVAVRVQQSDGQVVEADLRPETPITVGTDPACALRVTDPTVSAKHCEVALTLEGIRVRDLGSKNGTIVGDIRTYEAILPLEVAATLGSARMTAHVVGAPELRRLSGASRFGRAIGAHPLMRALYASLEEQIDREAKQNIVDGLLLVGEAGTGKELLAESFHEKSPRIDGPFLILDCTTEPEDAIEDQVTRRAGEGGILELAQGGTLYIKAVDAMTTRAQHALARAMKQNEGRGKVGAGRPFDVRVIATTDKDLRPLVDDGAFAGELFFRLVTIRVPPLRARLDDVPLLAEHFLSLQDPPRTPDDLPLGWMSMLKQQPWPGNVEELRSVVMQLFLAGTLQAQSVKAMIEQGDRDAPLPDYLLSLPWDAARAAVINDLEKRYLAAGLKEFNGNIKRVAQKFRVSRQYIHHLIKKHGLDT